MLSCPGPSSRQTSAADGWETWQLYVKRPTLSVTHTVFSSVKITMLTPLHISEMATTQRQCLYIHYGQKPQTSRPERRTTAMNHTLHPLDKSRQFVVINIGGHSRRSFWRETSSLSPASSSLPQAEERTRAEGGLYFSGDLGGLSKFVHHLQHNRLRDVPFPPIALMDLPSFLIATSQHQFWHTRKVKHTSSCGVWSSNHIFSRRGSMVSVHAGSPGHRGVETEPVRQMKRLFESYWSRATLQWENYAFHLNGSCRRAGLLTVAAIFLPNKLTFSSFKIAEAPETRANYVNMTLRNADPR